MNPSILRLYAAARRKQSRSQRLQTRYLRWWLGFASRPVLPDTVCVLDLANFAANAHPNDNQYPGASHRTALQSLTKSNNSSLHAQNPTARDRGRGDHGRGDAVLRGQRPGELHAEYAGFGPTHRGARHAKAPQRHVQLRRNAGVGKKRRNRRVLRRGFLHVPRNSHSVRRLLRPRSGKDLRSFAAIGRRRGCDVHGGRVQRSRASRVRDVFNQPERGKRNRRRDDCRLRDFQHPNNNRRHRHRDWQRFTT
mmetsp:Transcript_10223/g.33806  ORF Transcript_10223/g.33806 Transcript_10223/m.33806 type:complete len:251 (+) Transcript_10223:168-920(+)